MFAPDSTAKFNVDLVLKFPLVAERYSIVYFLPLNRGLALAQMTS